MSLVTLVADNGLEVRELSLSDVPLMYRLIDRNRDHLSRFDNKTSHLFPDESALRRSIRESASTPYEGKRFGIWNEEAVVGSVFLQAAPDNKKAEIMYWLGEEFTGKGYATRAVKRVCDYAFSDLDIPLLFACVNRKNLPSIAVLQRTGFQRRGSHLLESVLYYEKEDEAKRFKMLAYPLVNDTSLVPETLK
ncbi:GNAT family N-acetyltransferase [Candidatus Woesearchaeota archaeon]|nr:GNAT family N-acetyltransferase [Candidatus Woesearchaeota archaeon]